jgi:hypothetical protein
MSLLKLSAYVAVALLAGCANDQLANNQVAYGPGVGSDSGIDRDAFIAFVAASGPDCPAMDIHLRRVAPDQLSGVMFSSMQPGQRLSGIRGPIAPDGSVSLTVTPMMGSAQGGTLTGRMDNGALVVSMTGGRCPMNNIRLSH